jgi:hypothetical protein
MGFIFSTERPEKIILKRTSIFCFHGLKNGILEVTEVVKTNILGLQL